MAPSDRKRPSAPFPSREQIAAFIRESETRVGKRELARAFKLDAVQKVRLKAVLKEMERDGAIQRGRKRRFGDPGAMPPVAVIEVSGTDTDGELLGRPADWPEDAAAPVIYIAPERQSRSALAIGDRILARLTKTAPKTYEASTIRRLHAAPERALGVFTRVGSEGRIKPIDRRAKEEFTVAEADARELNDGELVWAVAMPGRPLGLKRAQIVERLGSAIRPKAISLIALLDHDIPTRFPSDALRQAEAAGAAGLADRVDLRTLPLVTIDGADARDFDDAVWAESDADPKNPDGWHLIVAIADVAWYVRPGDALDRAAQERGNSVYFPDRVVPMLPEALSNGWCSLVPGEDRPCLAVRMWIDGAGHLIRHRFERAMMRSAARLTYTQLQDARDGRPDDATLALLAPVIEPLYGAYGALARARTSRGVLDLDLAERRVILADDGAVARIERRERLDSHRLIEEFMITANVAAAETLEQRKSPCMYRVHDQPTLEKLESLRDFLASIDISFPRAQVIRAKDFNRVLAKVADTGEAPLVNEVVLRSQAQACYDPHNIGHFGLALRRYCHFTSPIRRYADLLVHRALIDVCGLGAGGHAYPPPELAKVAEHISSTERRAQAAERDAVDRFTAAYLATQVGAVFAARVSGVTRFGLFVSLDETGSDGLVPVSTLPDDYYQHDERHHRLVGRHGGLAFRLGDRVKARLVEADAITGGLIFHLADVEARPTARRKSAVKGNLRRKVKRQRR